MHNSPQPHSGQNSDAPSPVFYRHIIRRDSLLIISPSSVEVPIQHHVLRQAKSSRWQWTLRIRSYRFDSHSDEPWVRPGNAWMWPGAAICWKTVDGMPQRSLLLLLLFLLLLDISAPEDSVWTSVMAERPAESKTLSTFIDLQEDDPQLIAERLCNRFRLSVSVLNSRDYDHKTDAGKESKSYASPTWQARLDNIPRPLSWSEAVEMWRAWQQVDTDVHFAIVHCSCEVNMTKGEAIVFAEITVTGSGNVVLGALAEVLWKRRKDGQWLSDCYISFRGNHQNGGFV